MLVNHQTAFIKIDAIRTIFCVISILTQLLFDILSHFEVLIVVKINTIKRDTLIVALLVFTIKGNDCFYTVKLLLRKSYINNRLTLIMITTWFKPRMISSTPTIKLMI